MVIRDTEAERSVVRTVERSRRGFVVATVAPRVGGLATAAPTWWVDAREGAPTTQRPSSMSLTSPFTLLLAWGIAPLVVVLGSAGLGCGIQALAGMRLGALLIPTGFLTAITLSEFLGKLGLGATPTVVAILLLAAAGPAAALAAARSAVAGSSRLRWLRSERGAVALGRPETSSPAQPADGPRRGRLARIADHGAFWPALGALAAFTVGMAPLVGSGRAGIVGYVLSNDPSVHVSTVELLRDFGTKLFSPADSSYTAMSAQLGGYPLGSLAWPLITSVLFGMDAFFTWTPHIAVGSAMMALVGYAILRRIGAARPVAAVAGATVGCGYLPFSYLAQGSAKEPLLAVALYGTVALFALALDAGLTVRRL